MRITYVSAETSLKRVFFFAVFFILFMIIPLYSYFISYPNNYSIINFTEWAISSFNGLVLSSPDDAFLYWILFIIGPSVSFISLIWASFVRLNAIKALNSRLYLKSVDLKPYVIDFIFNKPQYNFSCPYSEVEKFRMKITTALARTKYGMTVVFKEITLKFTVLNGKEFTICNTGSTNPLCYIYRILDYVKNFNDFSYYFEGPSSDNKEKIDEYLAKGIKRAYSNRQTNSTKLASILLFSIGLSFMFMFKPMAENVLLDDFSFIFFIITTAPILISFIFDVLILKDELAGEV